ncbi:hypothetical protein [uncultured Anaerococcus sp.]|uniref:YkvI family membrane protein n=1 Tax=uncultured Anaerococcus sp. TaxID=293428 RepID=UPI002889161F|nr:hypothetical protein [uncultured Anaerococcus sp.]
MNKQTFKIMLAYVGVLTGAGLASGQELLQYFVSLGISGIVGIGMVGILHMLIGGILLILGSHYLATDHSDVFDEITNKFIAKFMDLSLVFTCFVVGFVMLAGAGSNLNQAFGVNVNVGRILCALLIIVVGMMDFSKVSQVIGSFTPFIVGFVLLGSVYTIFKYKPDWESLNAFASKLPSNFDNVGFSVLNYFGMCLMTAVSMGLVLGGDELSTENAGRGGLIGGAIVGVMGVLITLTLFIRVEEVYKLDIPMLYVIEDISPILGFLMAVVIFGMIFNTGISLFYALARRFSNDDERRFKIMLVSITGVGFVLSFLGFKKLVSIFYPIIGYIGIFMMALLVFAYFKERSAIRRESMKRLGIRHYMRKKLDDDLDFTKKDQERLNKLIDSSHIDNEEIKDKVEETVQEAIDNNEEPITDHGEN